MKRRITAKHKYLAFDIETAEQFADGNAANRKSIGIACAATLAENEKSVRFFYSDKAERMTKEDAAALVRYLQRKVEEGHTIVTWNGASFDFHILAEESKLYDECAELALHHVDMMFQVVCARGHFLSLDKAAKGHALGGKSADAKASEVPALWLAGERERVLAYLAQDVKTTLQLAKAIERTRTFRWQSSAGKEKKIEVERLLTVEEALRLPLPNTSGMDNPPNREQMLSWMKEKKS